MGPREARFTEADRAWVIANTPRTLQEIAKSTGSCRRCSDEA